MWVISTGGIDSDYTGANNNIININDYSTNMLSNKQKTGIKWERREGVTGAR